MMLVSAAGDRPGYLRRARDPPGVGCDGADHARNLGAGGRGAADREAHAQVHPGGPAGKVDPHHRLAAGVPRAAMQSGREPLRSAWRRLPERAAWAQPRATHGRPGPQATRRLQSTRSSWAVTASPGLRRADAVGRACRLRSPAQDLARAAGAAVVTKEDAAASGYHHLAKNLVAIVERPLVHDSQEPVPSGGHSRDGPVLVEFKWILDSASACQVRRSNQLARARNGSAPERPARLFRCRLAGGERMG
eukprot:scaffold7204_cov354-Prasinococcus_capsulatus_cf.AAC.8